jgi:DNA-binding Lrp family transcriptional regulator
MIHKLDNINLEILRICRDADVSPTIRELAEFVGLSSTPTYARVVRLLNLGLLRSGARTNVRALRITESGKWYSCLENNYDPTIDTSDFEPTGKA